MPSLQLRLRSVRKSPPELRVATSRLESMSPHHQASVFPYTVDDRAQANPQFQSTHSLGEKGRGKGWEHLCTCLKMFQLRILERKIGLGLNFGGDISLVNNIKKKDYALANRSSTMKIKFQSQTLVYQFMGNNGFRRGEILSLKISGLLVQMAAEHKSQ